MIHCCRSAAIMGRVSLTECGPIVLSIPPALRIGPCPHDLLAPVYGWFTECFDTLDLKDAKALLDQLA